jgi:hypothetical protein
MSWSFHMVQYGTLQITLQLWRILRTFSSLWSHDILPNICMQSQCFTKHICHDCTSEHDFKTNLIWSHTRDANLHVRSRHFAQLHVQVRLHDKPEMKPHLSHKYVCAVTMLGMDACPNMSSQQTWQTWNEVALEAQYAMWPWHAEVWQRLEGVGQGGQVSPM